MALGAWGLREAVSEPIPSAARLWVGGDDEDLEVCPCPGVFFLNPLPGHQAQGTLLSLTLCLWIMGLTRVTHCAKKVALLFLCPDLAFKRGGPGF